MCGGEEGGTEEDGSAELLAVVHRGGFWRLVPDHVPRRYAVPTRQLLERVRDGLGRLAE
ncbi:hypothetical protein [Streptomyces fuscigenes]|uniref:hypothetical protein n=1 Tax=Streptomyces fuscigenes TaxID=1528880 RepID=UPI001F163C0D|nr:hypothetical protein [Streptomyces fuscigenes]MCF3961071.1 hypothetical protein [Streptomyces fuscigenes]